MLAQAMGSQAQGGMAGQPDAQAQPVQHMDFPAQQVTAQPPPPAPGPGMAGNGAQTPAQSEQSALNILHPPDSTPIQIPLGAPPGVASAADLQKQVTPNKTSAGGGSVKSPFMGELNAGEQTQIQGSQDWAKVAADTAKQTSANIKGQLGFQQAQAQAAEQKAQQDAQWVQGHMAALDAKTNELYNTHVDPNRYYANMNTGAKVFSLLAMGIGGADQSLNGRKSNQVADAIQNQITNDINAQVEDIRTKKSAIEAGTNLVSQYMKAGADLRTAKAAADAAMWDAMVVKANDGVVAGNAGADAAARAKMYQGEVMGAFVAKKDATLNAVTARRNEDTQNALGRAQLAALNAAPASDAAAQAQRGQLYKGPIPDAVYNQMGAVPGVGNAEDVRIPLGNGFSVAAKNKEAAGDAVKHNALYNSVMADIGELEKLYSNGANVENPNAKKRASAISGLILDKISKLTSEGSQARFNEALVQAKRESVPEHPLGQGILGLNPIGAALNYVNLVGNRTRLQAFKKSLEQEHDSVMQSVAPGYQPIGGSKQGVAY